MFVFIFEKVGTYEESPLDFYSSRLPKKQRKRTLVEELMADAEFRRLVFKSIFYTLNFLISVFYNTILTLLNGFI